MSPWMNQVRLRKEQIMKKNISLWITVMGVSWVWTATFMAKNEIREMINAPIAKSVVVKAEKKEAKKSAQPVLIVTQK